MNAYKDNNFYKVWRYSDFIILLLLLLNHTTEYFTGSGPLFIVHNS